MSAQTDEGERLVPDNADADYGLVNRGRCSNNEVYHKVRPGEGNEDMPACELGTRNPDAKYRRVDPDETDKRLCGHCKGKEPGSGGWGSAKRYELLDADPEDFGLDPLPEGSD